MKPQRRDAMKLIRAITRSKPETIRKVDDNAAYEAECKLLKGYVPSPEQIAEEAAKIRREKGDDPETQSAIRELIDADEIEELDE